MGIVVTIVMLLGLIALSGIMCTLFNHSLIGLRAEICIIFLLVIGGSWNTFWYGIQYWPTFWAKAAVVSGIFMLLSALLLVGRRYYSSYLATYPLGGRIATFCIFLGLIGSFLLYGITLVQLNLGYPIIH